MRFLILSCNTGGGHNTCAGAIQEAFTSQGDCCEIKDSLSFVSDRLSRFLSWGHSVIYRRIPGLFRTGYGFVENHPAMLREGRAAYKLLTNGTKQLNAAIRQGQYDAVICTHVFSGMLLSQMLKDHSVGIKTAFVATDYTCSPGVASSDLDCYFIPASSLSEEFIAKGVPVQKLIPTGIPVRREFYQTADKATAKQDRGIDPAHTHLLLMCGSMGCGPIKKLTKLLSAGMDETMELSVICGTNTNLCRQLGEKFANCPNIHILGFVNDMSSMMDSADLYLTKPGGLSTTEAAAKKLPMVFVDAVAGCEAYNLRYYVQLGCAVTADSTKKLAELCLELLRNEKRRAQMAQALETLPPINAAERIRDMMRSEQKAG